MREPLPATLVPLSHAMRLITLVFALCVVSARCATIPDKVTGEIEKKIEDAVKEVLDKENKPNEESSPQETLDQSNSISYGDNSLKKVDIADIPVKVVVEEVQPSVKSSSNQEVIKVEEEYRRPEVDLEHPGNPQHQEHDSQNPEHHEHAEGDMSAFIKQNVIETQVVFNNEVENLQNKIKSLITTDQQKHEIEDQLKRLQENFQAQIQKLSETVQKYVPEPEEKPALRTLPEIEAQGKQDAPAATGTPAAQPSQNPIAQYFQQLQQSISNNIAQMQEQMQSYFNGNNQQSSQPAGAQSDEGAATSRPSLWQSITNIFNPANNNQASQQQADTPAGQTPTPNRPIVQAIQSNIQNNPIYQSVASVFNPNRPAANKPEAQKPEATQASQPAAEKPQAPSEGTTNTEPAKPEAQKQKPESVQYAQSGPIRQILIEKNPIVQGIAGAVQRIQQTMTNPDKPRDGTPVIKKDENSAAPVSEEKKHTYYNANQQVQSEHNNDVDCSGLKEQGDQPEKKPEEISMEPLKEDPAKEEKEQPTKTE